MSSTFKINNSGGIQATLVANAFIDHYMLQANGEFVKIYLYLLIKYTFRSNCQN